jgi:hypothetical protein
MHVYHGEADPLIPVSFARYFSHQLSLRGTRDAPADAPLIGRANTYCTIVPRLGHFSLFTHCWPDILTALTTIPPNVSVPPAAAAAAASVAPASAALSAPPSATAPVAPALTASSAAPAASTPSTPQQPITSPKVAPGSPQK